MHTEPVIHHKNRHVAEKVEGLLGKAMIVAVVVLAIGLVWMIIQAGDTQPSWMR